MYTVVRESVCASVQPGVQRMWRDLDSFSRYYEPSSRLEAMVQETMTQRAPALRC